MLVGGALKVDPARFFSTLAVARFARFAAETLLALAYGRQIVEWMRSEMFRYAVAALTVVAITGTTVSIYQIARKRA